VDFSITDALLFGNRNIALTTALIINVGYKMDYKSTRFPYTSKERLHLINKLGFSLTEKDLTEIGGNTHWNGY